MLSKDNKKIITQEALQKEHSGQVTVSNLTIAGKSTQKGEFRP